MSATVGRGTDSVYRIRASRLGGLDRVHDVGSTVAGHPDPATLHAAVQVATTSVLLEERVDRS
jgi:hypothetical protein